MMFLLAKAPCGAFDWCVICTKSPHSVEIDRCAGAKDTDLRVKLCKELSRIVKRSWRGQRGRERWLVYGANISDEWRRWHLDCQAVITNRNVRGEIFRVNIWDKSHLFAPVSCASRSRLATLRKR